MSHFLHLFDVRDREMIAIVNLTFADLNLWKRKFLRNISFNLLKQIASKRYFQVIRDISIEYLSIFYEHNTLITL